VSGEGLCHGCLQGLRQGLREEFLTSYVWPRSRRGRVREIVSDGDLSGAPLLAKLLVDIARKEGATHVAHGCTGKGNDQVRFEVSIAALAPDLKVLAPCGSWEFKSREEEIAYARKNNIPVAGTVANPYSIDENIWGQASNAVCLKIDGRTPADAYQRTISPELAPDTPEYVDIDFEEGSLSAWGVSPGAGEPGLYVERHGRSPRCGRIDLVETPCRHQVARDL